MSEPNAEPGRRNRIRTVATIVGALAITIACGGNGDSNTQTPPSTSPATTAQNPCPATSLTASSVGETPAQVMKRSTPIETDPRGTLGDVLWRHAAAEGRLVPSSVITPRATVDVGEVAVVQDEGDLIAPANTFDLQSVGLRFAPRDGGGYDVTRIDGAFRATLGDPITLGDDDSAPAPLTFTFRFFGLPQTNAFINSDGNITFGEADTASTARSVSRLLAGQARVAPLFADLDPSVGGTIFRRSAADAFTVTWCSVRVFDSTRLATFQTTLFPDGSLEMKFAAGSTLTASDGIVAISPGRTSGFVTVDFSRTTGTSSPASSAIGERFSARPDLDLVALARKFYRTHGDTFDQLLVWTDDVMTAENAFAFEVTVANNVSGIGQNIFTNSSQFGSAGALNSVVQMDNIAKFPEDPATKFLGENNTVSVMGQEVGHRWLAYLEFSDQNRQRSGALLGRDAAHWSFFFNSDASVMEGNRIQDLGGGSFKTVAAVERYSLLDQYAMGLVRDMDVAPMFYVESPANVSNNAQPDSPPRIGVTFSGTRRDVLVNDIIEVMGRRQPPADQSPRVYRQAFLFVVSNNRTAAPTAIARIDRIRRAWETFYAQATDNHGRAETRLQPGT